MTKKEIDQAWCLTSNPSTLGSRGGLSPEVKSSRPAWQTWWNPINTKNKKLARWVVGACNPSYLGGWGRRNVWTWEEEVAVSSDHAIAFQPGQQKWNSISKIQKPSRARWLMPVIPALREQGRWIMGSGDQDHPGQHGKTLSLLKIQKIS